MRKTAILIVSCLIVSCAFFMNSPLAAQPADLVILGGQIVTVDGQDDAGALAARDGRILYVGAVEKAREFIGAPTRVIKLADEMVMPGFIESHAHFVGLGEAMLSVDLTPARTWDDIVALAKSAAENAKPGEWILGRGWHQEKWDAVPDLAIEGLPLHGKLSEATPDNPVLFTHASGHMALVNAAAMERANITSATADPQGGKIIRDKEGNPTGALRENAEELVAKIVKRELASKERVRAAIRVAAQECLENGVTSFQDAGTSFDTARIVREFAEQEELPIRLWMMIRDTNDKLERLLPEFRTINDPPRFTIRGVKRSLDGALGAHGAWMLEPYDDMPSSAGLNTYLLDELEETARIALENECQLCVHAIGDRANHETLDLYERVLNGNTKLRWRIEHAQHLDERDIPRFAQLGVIAAMQANHCTSDAIFVVQRLGMRRAAAGGYVWRKLIDAGTIIANGTDAPVEDLNPIPCLYSSVTRKLSSGTSFYPEQSMTRKEALDSYTINAAYAAFEEDEKGSLKVGKLADIVILDRNLLTCDEADIPATQVKMTIVGGRVAYEAN